MKSQGNLTSIEKFYEYLSDVLISLNCLRQQQVKEIFLKALKDFFEKNITVECLNVVADQLYYVFNKPHEVDIYYERDLANALFDATEIFYYYSHQDEDPANKKIYEAQIKNLKEYYEKNKHLLKDFPKET